MFKTPKTLCLRLILAVMAVTTAVEANNRFIFPFEINRAINGLNTRLKNANLNELGFYELRSFWNGFQFERLLNYKSSGISDRSMIFKRPANVSHECLGEAYKVARALFNQELWAIRVVDSFGKPPSGILEGAFDWPGEFVECTNSSNSAANWTAKYCSVSTDDKSKPQGPNSQKIFFTYGLCAPFVCSRDDIASALNFVLDEFHFNSTGLLDKNFTFTANNVVCQEPKQLDLPAKIAIGFILTIIIIILLFTIVDIYRLYIHNSIFKTEIQNVLIQINDDTVNPSEIEHLLHTNLEQNPLPNEPRIFKLIPCFSIVRSTKRIFNLNVEKNQLNCLHSFRFLTMSWIILSHSFGFILFFSDNIAVIPDYIRSFPLTVVTNGFLSVDTFFLLSGVLGSFMFLKERSKPNVTFSFLFFLRYYLHRFIRISPPYFIVLMISILLSKYFGSGPLYPTEGFEPIECRTNWWRNVLYINNFFKSEEMCLPISWYLSNDMQFHWVAPLMLIPLALGFNNPYNTYKRKIFIGLLVSLLFLTASIVSTIVILALNPDSELGIFGGNSTVYSEQVYFKPWSRIGPFVVGIILGYILFVKKTQIRPKINIAVNNTLWISAILLSSLCIFGLYPDFRDFPKIYFTRWPHILYQGFSRVLWALGLSYMIYACETSNGGIVNRVLTWKIWLPLSRLTYSAYLIHLTVIFYFNTTQQHLFHWQNSTLMYLFVSNLVFSYTAAFFVCVFFELPLIGLEKFIIKKN